MANQALTFRQGLPANYLGLSGGIIHDALIVKAAKKSKTDKVLMFNIDDFSSVWPEGEAHLVVP
jgi:hypothetical protein